jgi:DNA polymerase
MQESNAEPVLLFTTSNDWHQQAREMSLEELRITASTCTRCRLCEERTNVVFGVGSTDSPVIAFVGEGPGADEDLKGEPFVGRAGQLLTAAIEKGLGLKRDDVYICNVVKCRPPGNRTPLPDEVEQCSAFLFRQLELVKPKAIITLGQAAQLALVGRRDGITKLRGTWLEWEGIRVMPTFHPAYLLRNPGAKRMFWDDLKQVMEYVGLKGPTNP